MMYEVKIPNLFNKIKVEKENYVFKIELSLIVKGII